MKIRKFVAADMREALDEIKRELGSEAMIVATKPVRRGLLGSGVEVTAALEQADDGEPSGPTMRAPQPPPRAKTSTPAPSGPTERGLSDSDVERIMMPLRSELRAIRSLLRDARDQAPTANHDERSLAELANKDGLVAPPARRIIALVGPTGVGKTTTLAKIAARAALVERRTVSILTLDTYRVGGEEQMRAFADLMGVPLTLVPDAARFPELLVNHHAKYDLVLIDTAGHSPRDHEALRALEAIFANVDDIEVHLTLSAGSSARHVDACVRHYSALAPRRLLFTKVDEAVELEQIVRAPLRHGLPVSFITTGQRVPEDLEDATAQRLHQLASAGMMTMHTAEAA